MQLKEEISAPFRWYVLKVKPRFEKRVAVTLANGAHECFLPLYRSKRVWSDRIKELELPLFAGYLFCRFSIERRVQVLRAPGVVSIVKTGTDPAPVADKEIADLKTLVASDYPLAPWPFLRVGEKVRICHGALKGVEGIVLQVRNSSRLIVSVSLLQRSVAVELDSAIVDAVCHLAL